MIQSVPTRKRPKSRRRKPARGAASPKANRTSKRNARAGGAAQPKGGNDAVGRMNNALSAEYAEIKELLVAAETQDVMARYELAHRFETIRNGDGKNKKYGAGAVKKLANALGLSKSTVNDYANVAKAWPQKRKFESLLKKKDKFGKPLTWSHFVVIATAEDADQRETMLDGSLNNGWTVRDVKAGGQSVDSSEDTESSSAQPKLPRPLALAAANFLTQLETVKKNAEVFDSQLMEGLENSTAEELTNDLLETLQQARDGLADFYKSARAQIDKHIKHVARKCQSANNN